MRPIEKTEEYKGRVIVATPHHSGCSDYALTIALCDGTPIRHVPAAGNSPGRALALGREMVDFDESLG
jgi:hypothetical protein